jgi:hypothetical protein
MGLDTAWDGMGADGMGADGMGGDEMRVDERRVDEMRVDEMGVDAMGLCAPSHRCIDESLRHAVHDRSCAMVVLIRILMLTMLPIK